MTLAKTTRTDIHFPFVGMVAQRGKFPTGRRTICCPNKVRSGEPVVVIRPKTDAGEITTVIHARCVADVLQWLPPDPKDIQSKYDRIRDRLKKETTSE